MTLLVYLAVFLLAVERPKLSLSLSAVRQTAAVNPG